MSLCTSAQFVSSLERQILWTCSEQSPGDANLSEVEWSFMAFDVHHVGRPVGPRRRNTAAEHGPSGLRQNRRRRGSSPVPIPALLAGLDKRDSAWQSRPHLQMPFFTLRGAERAGWPPQPASQRPEGSDGQNNVPGQVDAGQRHLPDAAHLSLNTLPLDSLPTAASIHSDSGLACNIAAFCPLP